MPIVIPAQGHSPSRPPRA